MKLKFLIILLLLTVRANSQNLTRNHDFSQLDFVSGMLLYNSALSNWKPNVGQDSSLNVGCGSAHDSTCIGSPTYPTCPGGHRMNSFNSYYLPYPDIGQGYAVLGFYQSPITIQGINGNGIGIIRGELIAPLFQDTSYCTEMHVYFTTGYYNGTHSNFSHDGLGMHFNANDSLPSAFPWDDGIIPQVTGFGPILSDTAWQRVSGSFVADGGESYVYLGNFNPLSPPTLHPNAWNNTDSMGIIFFDAVYVYNCRDTLFKVVQQDTTVCWGQSVQLQPELRGFKLQDTVRSFTWQTPSGSFTSADSAFTATEPGNYALTVTLNKRFTATTNFTVTWVPEAPDTNFLPDSLALCPGVPQLISLPQIPGARYRWSNGDTTYYTTIGVRGNYTAQIITPCWLHTESFEAYQTSCGTRIFIPNAFTPDGDGTNDYFEIYGPLQPFTLLVTDRWGTVVYQNSNYQNNWDGTYQGQALPAGVYSYRIIYSKYQGGPKNYDKMGTVTLIR